MKIQKKQPSVTVKACSVAEAAPVDIPVSYKDEASKLILQAIDCLAQIADKDDQARASIADLGVVLLDLK